MKKSNLTREALESMSEEELAELLVLADETAKHTKKEVVYTPNKIQEKFHRSASFVRALFSGNGVGKTTACIQEAIWAATGTHPWRPVPRIPSTTIIVLDDPSKADNVYLRTMKQRGWYDVSKLKLDKHGRSHTQEVIFPNGSNWIFMTHEMNEDKFESIECSGVIFDEPPPRFIYIALIRGQREKDMAPWIAFAGTPRGKNAPWMHAEIYKPWFFKSDPEIECFFGSTYDNLHNLDPDTINRWKKRFTAEELKTRLFGEFEFLSGRIFDAFARDTHVEKNFTWPRHWPCILGIDPHLRKNHVAVLLGVDPDGDLHAIMELETSLSGRKAIEFFINAVSRYPVKYGICDNFGMMSGTGGEDRKSFIELWNEQARLMGAKVYIRPTTKAEKGDDEWIEDMKDLLRVEDGTPKFRVMEACIKLISDFETYIWDEHKGAGADGKEVKEKPLGMNQDFLMALKYAIATKPWRTLTGKDKIYSRKATDSKAQEYESHAAFIRE